MKYIDTINQCKAANNIDDKISKTKKMWSTLIIIIDKIESYVRPPIGFLRFKEFELYRRAVFIFCNDLFIPFHVFQIKVEQYFGPRSKEKWSKKRVVRRRTFVFKKTFFTLIFEKIEKIVLERKFLFHYSEFWFVL